MRATIMRQMYSGENDINLENIWNEEPHPQWHCILNNIWIGDRPDNYLFVKNLSKWCQKWQTIWCVLFLFMVCNLIISEVCHLRHFSIFQFSFSMAFVDLDKWLCFKMAIISKNSHVHLKMVAFKKIFKHSKK